MKILDVTTELYRWPRETPITNGLHTYTHVTLGLVKIATDEGTTGIGLGAAGAIQQATVETLKPLLIGEDPLDVERLWHKMWVPKLIGRRGMTTRAISAIDIGLWDLRAKIAGMPLYKMLGGFRNRVPTYIAGGYYEPGKGLKELAQEMIDNVEMGATAVKMKVGAVSIREDAERVGAVRQAIGPDVKLMVDANCAYRPYEAIQLAKRIEEYDPFWFEEPIAADDYAGHRRLAVATSIPIATGENEYSTSGASRKRCGPGINPWINSPPRSAAVTALPGMPKVSMGIRLPPTTPLLAASAEHTPSMAPFPNSSGVFETRRASLRPIKAAMSAPAPGTTPTAVPISDERIMHPLSDHSVPHPGHIRPMRGM